MFESTKMEFLRKFKNISGFDYNGTFKEAVSDFLRKCQFSQDELKLISESAQQLIQEEIRR